MNEMVSKDTGPQNLNIKLAEIQVIVTAAVSDKIPETCV